MTPHLRPRPHPFAVTATMRTCALINYAVDADVLAAALPKGIRPVLLSGTGWLSVVVADMRRLRPSRLPPTVGLSYNQIVYRAVVEHRGERGVHFLRSDADNRLACVIGNALSMFRFHPADISLLHSPDGVTARVSTSDGTGDLSLDASTAHRGSPTTRLGDLDRLRAELVELFVAFDHDAVRDEHQVLRIARGAWNIEPLDIDNLEVAFLDRGPIFDHTTATFDSMLVAHHLPYRWHPLTTHPSCRAETIDRSPAVHVEPS